MPRLHPRILHQARKTDPLLPLILQATRDLASAKNELRWLKEFVSSPPQQGQQQHSKHDNQDLSHRKLHRLCYDRSHGKPLQYILSSEYFGDLEISCAKGVLIPR
jgi:methylase of polypeptide subunit release factors